MASQMRDQLTYYFSSQNMNLGNHTFIKQYKCIADAKHGFGVLAKTSTPKSKLISLGLEQNFQNHTELPSSGRIEPYRPRTGMARS